MTVNELVAHIADELNQTSPESLARITRQLNKRYRQVTSAVGLITTRREEVSKAATIGDRFITFTGIEKIDAVYRKVSGKTITLTEITHDDMLALNPRDEPPTKYSLFSVTGNTVTLWLDCTPNTTFTLYAVGVADASTLSGTESPAIPESFQDVLIYGVCADEYRKKEKTVFAQDAERKFELRLSDLRMFLAKSAYIDIYRGKNAPSEGWWDTEGK